MRLPPKRVRDRFRGKAIVVAWAEHASGCGWHNLPVWVITRDVSGVLAQECLQPEEYNREIGLLYEVNAKSAEQMTAHVRYWLALAPEVSR